MPKPKKSLISDKDMRSDFISLLKDYALNNRADEVRLSHLKKITKYQIKDSDIYLKLANTQEDIGGYKKNSQFIKESIESYRIAISLNKSNWKAYYGLGCSLHKLSLVSTNKIELLKEEITNYEEAIRLKAKSASVHYNYGNALHKLALSKEKRGKDLLKRAVAQYKKAIVIDPYKQYAYNNWGNVLLSFVELGFTNEETFILEAMKKYEKTIEIDPYEEMAYSNLSKAYSFLYKLRGNTDISLLKEAIKNSKKAIELNPNYANGLYNYANDLRRLAKIQRNTYALLKKACGLYEKSFKIKPDNETASNWGLTLEEMAGLRGNDLETIKQALHKYQLSRSLNPSSGLGLNGQGYCLILLGKSGIRPKVNYKKAIEVLKEVTDKPRIHRAHYNIACAYALMNDQDNALVYLKKAIESNLFSAEQVQNDKDLTSLHNRKEFQSMIQRLKSRNL